MTRIESEEEALLALGRATLAPSAADHARVRVSLTSALAATLPELTSIPEPTSIPEAASEASAVVRSPSLGAAKIWVVRLLAAALIGGTGTGVGYWAGYRAGQLTPSAHLHLPPPRTPLAAPPTESAAPSAPTAPLSSNVAPPQSPSPVRSNTARRRDLTAPRSNAEIPVDEELRTLRRAERALRQGNPRLALVLLEDLNRSTRGGRLLEERAAEMVIARCALEPNEATRLSLEFERAHADSVYLDRVKRSCGPGGE
jgi:hypothetical protein